MMSNLDMFTNQAYNVLSFLYDKRVDKTFVAITQSEIADELGSNKMTINNIFKDLKQSEYIIQEEKKLGRYHLTDKAIKLVEGFRKSIK